MLVDCPKATEHARIVNSCNFRKAAGRRTPRARWRARGSRAAAAVGRHAPINGRNGAQCSLTAGRLPPMALAATGQGQMRTDTACRIESRRRQLAILPDNWQVRPTLPRRTIRRWALTCSWSRRHYRSRRSPGRGVRLREWCLADRTGPRQPGDGTFTATFAPPQRSPAAQSSRFRAF